MHRDGHQLAFVIGHYRSGSTWLSNLLSLHPGIRSLRETHAFRLAFESADLASCHRVLFREPSWADRGPWNFVRTRAASLVRSLRRTGQASLSWTERPTTVHDLSLRNRRALERLLRASSDPGDYCRRLFEFLFHTLQPSHYLLEKSVSNVFFVPQIKAVFPQCRLLAIERDGRDVVVSDKYHLLNEYGRRQSFAASVAAWRRAMETQ